MSIEIAPPGNADEERAGLWRHPQGGRVGPPYGWELLGAGEQPGQRKLGYSAGGSGGIVGNSSLKRCNGRLARYLPGIVREHQWSPFKRELTILPETRISARTTPSGGASTGSPLSNPAGVRTCFHRLT